MEKTIITKVLSYLVLKMLGVLAKKTDNKIDDKVIDTVNGLINYDVK